jgi:hypothetical protein
MGSSDEAIADMEEETEGTEEATEISARAQDEMTPLFRPSALSANTTLIALDLDDDDETQFRIQISVNHVTKRAQKVGALRHALIMRRDINRQKAKALSGRLQHVEILKRTHQEADSRGSIQSQMRGASTSAGQGPNKQQQQPMLQQNSHFPGYSHTQVSQGHVSNQQLQVQQPSHQPYQHQHQHQHQHHHQHQHQLQLQHQHHQHQYQKQQALYQYHQHQQHQQRQQQQQQHQLYTTQQQYQNQQSQMPTHNKYGHLLQQFNHFYANGNQPHPPQPSHARSYQQNPPQASHPSHYQQHPPHSSHPSHYQQKPHTYHPQPSYNSTEQVAKVLNRNSNNVQTSSIARKSDAPSQTHMSNNIVQTTANRTTSATNQGLSSQVQMRSDGMLSNNDHSMASAIINRPVPIKGASLTFQALPVPATARGDTQSIDHSGNGSEASKKRKNVDDKVVDTEAIVGGKKVKVLPSTQVRSLSTFTGHQIQRFSVAFGYDQENATAEKEAQEAQDWFHHKAKANGNQADPKKSKHLNKQQRGWYFRGQIIRGLIKEQETPSEPTKKKESKPERLSAGGVSKMLVEVFQAPQFPTGWIVKTFDRPHDANRFDSYWFSPKTSKRFRSRAEVKRFLALLPECGGDEELAHSLWKKKEPGRRKSGENAADKKVISNVETANGVQIQN